MSFYVIVSCILWCFIQKIYHVNVYFFQIELIFYKVDHFRVSCGVSNTSSNQNNNITADEADDYFNVGF